LRIGIDVATLSLKRIVDRVILISGGTDATLLPSGEGNPPPFPPPIRSERMGGG